MGFDIYEMCVNAIPGWTSVGVPTIGQCKGTLEALMAADMVLIFHVPLFSKWLKRGDEQGRARADDHRRARRSVPAAVAARPEGGGAACAQRSTRETKEVRVTSKAGTDCTYRCGEYPVMSQYGMADEPGRFDHWGVGLLHTFPNEGSATAGW